MMEYVSWRGRSFDGSGFHTGRNRAEGLEGILGGAVDI